ncbi:MAG: LamG domain-containing protein [Thermoguttaceae bacterium]|nr:LamG domain-containing protein [Thermoguttaceae bacterium]MDW8039380.1 LamG domain-containing protein [Thermoguttaceae bacterium]
MSSSFDPYRKWLGIPPKDQPPNHYRLLGIDLFESDPDVISNAADARMAHIRTFQTGPYSEWSQKLLNEIAAAKVCLLNPEKKAEYDAKLRAQLAGEGLGAGGSGGMQLDMTGGAETPPSSSVSVPSSLPRAQAVSLGQASAIQESWPGERSAFSGERMPGSLPQGLASATGLASPTARLLASRRRAWQGPALLTVGVAALILLGALVFWMLQGTWEPRELAGQGVAPRPLGAQGVGGGQKPSEGISTGGASSKGGQEAKRKKEKVFPLPARPAESPMETSTLSKGDASGKEKPASLLNPPEAEATHPKEKDSAEGRPTGLPKGSQKQKPGDEETESAPASKPGDFEGLEESSQPEKLDKVPPKHPIPTEAEQAKAVSEIRDLLREDFAAAEKTGTPRAFAEKLLQYAQQSSDQVPAQYVLFQMAAEWAARAADGSLLHEALDGLAQRFQVDSHLVLIAVLEKAAAAPGEENLLRDRLEMLQEMAEELVAQDDYGNADRLAKAALAMSRKIKDTDLQRQTGAWTGKIERLSQQHAKLREYLDRLAKNHEDPEANLAVGRWYAFLVGQWEKGLPYLVKANQPEIAEAARLDLKGPQDAGEQQKLAELWWQLGEKASGEERLAMLARAVYWYEQALPHLSGLSKTSAQRRIEIYQTSLGPKESVRITKGEYVLYFDGQKTYATVPNFMYDGTKPLTVEVIVKAQSAKQHGAIIGNLTPTGGWVLALAKHPTRSSSEPYWVFFFHGRLLRSTYSEAPAEIGQRVMLAAVYDGEEIRIFVNGQRQYTAHPLARHRPGGTTLLIGAGTSPTGARTNFFHGIIEQIRISFVVRYTNNFVPPDRLEKDKDTELLLRFDTGPATTVRDLSGARRAARIVAGKWIKRDASNP